MGEALFEKNKAKNVCWEDFLTRRASLEKKKNWFNPFSKISILKSIYSSRVNLLKKLELFLPIIFLAREKFSGKE